MTHFHRAIPTHHTTHPPQTTPHPPHATPTTAQVPFDMENGPMFKAKVYRHRGDSYLLLLWHHICIDLWAVVLMFDELRALYTACVAASFDADVVLPAGVPRNPVTYTQCTREQVSCGGCGFARSCGGDVGGGGGIVWWREWALEGQWELGFHCVDAVRS